MKFVSTKIPEKMQKDSIFTHKFQVKKTYKSFRPEWMYGKIKI